jgi:hypothetical protein
MSASVRGCADELDNRLVIVVVDCLALARVLLGRMPTPHYFADLSSPGGSRPRSGCLDRQTRQVTYRELTIGATVSHARHDGRAGG